MQCYTELTPPTAVTHSLSLPFVSADSRNLVVAKTSLLQIFSLKVVSEELDVTTRAENRAAKDSNPSDRRSNGDAGLESSFLVADTALVRSEHATSTRLVLLAEYALSGTVTSMVSVKTLGSKSGGHSLLIGFRDAKLSLVEWDPGRHGLATTSIHYFEQDEVEGSPWAPDLGDCVNYLSADPQSRCAALKFGARNLAILPFKQGDEDVAMEDWDEELDGPRPKSASAQGLTNGVSNANDVAYGSSFVLRFSSLDPAIICPIHLAFLYEYREPTFAILSSTISPTLSLLQERKDHLSYMVFTLDLQQKASTTILAVNGLPYDLFRIIPLQPPVGGALLVGGNELIHIDQSGKTNGVAVNTFAKQCTAFGLADQSGLEIRLEGSTIEQLSVDSGELLLVLSTGSLYILGFKLDGRSVSGLSLRRVADELGGSVLPSTVSCVSRLTKNVVFVGSEDSDACVLGWAKKSKQVDRRKLHSNGIQPDDVDDLELEADADDDDDDDDLYGDEPAKISIPGFEDSRVDSSNSKAGDYLFRVHDRILNIAPLRDITFGRVPEDAVNEDITGDLQLVATSGSCDAGSLVILKREIEPEVIGRFDFAEARGVWTVNVRKPGALVPEDNDLSTGSRVNGVEVNYDRLMIVTKTAVEASEESAVYALTDAGFEALTGTEFDPAAGATVEVGTFGSHMRVVQVLESEVRIYDGDLGLAQILPMFDDETGADPKIVSASIADPFTLLVRDDASIYLAECDSSNELEELEREDDLLLTTKWVSGCLYADTMGVFVPAQTGKGQKAGEIVVMFLLSSEGALYIYALPHLSRPIYKAEGICFLPTTVAPQYVARRSPAREILTEIIVANLGDKTAKSPYLILRAASDDLTMYEPFRIGNTDLSRDLHFAKVNNPHLAKNPGVAAEESSDVDDNKRDHPMRAIDDLGGHSAVFLPGHSPAFVMKSSKTTPKIIGLRGTSVRGLSSFHTAGCDRGFMYLDDRGVARVSQLPNDTVFDLGLPMRRIDFGENVTSVTYHPSSETYAVATSLREPFELPKDDDYHREWAKEDVAFRPTIERSSIKLLSATNWAVIGTVEMEAGEVVMCMDTLNLEVSEETHERRQLITIGTAISKGEDLAVKGCVYVFDVVTVVPQPGRPETNKKLKLIAREAIPRGAVTAVSEIGTQGFMIIAQGQKCMVRGLKEDGTLLPVAFMDMQTYVTSIKELTGSGLCVMADALKGVWLAGYTEEPYRMLLFGKQTENMEMVAAEIFPIGEQLYIVAADIDCNLHVLQYDPEHPKSLHGQRLLHRATFSLGGHIPSTMTLLPRTRSTTAMPASEDAMDIAADETIPEHEILMTTTSGALVLLSPLSEVVYRRLSTLTNHLSNTLYHACGLNPKAYRIDENAPEAVIGGRPVVDGTILQRWMELGTQKRAEVAGRIGVDGEQVREDLEGLMGGIGYL